MYSDRLALLGSLDIDDAYPLLSRLDSRLIFKDLNHETAEAHVEALCELMRRALRVIPQEVDLHSTM